MPQAVQAYLDGKNFAFIDKVKRGIIDLYIDDFKKIYADDELSEGATIRNFRIVQTEGSRQVSREIAHYNLGKCSFW